MENNNPFDNITFAAESHRIRFGCLHRIFAIAVPFLVLIVTTILMRNEKFVHYAVHVPCSMIRDLRYTALEDDTQHDCSYCRELKQRVITELLTPEERKIIQERDRRNIVQAREAAADHLRFQRELEEQRRRDNEYRWKRDLEYYSK